MANRRNFKRHRGLANPILDAAIESAAATPNGKLTPDEGDAAALHRRNFTLVARPEEVARAKRLLADPDYPPKEIIQSVAGLLAEHFDAPEPR